MKTIRKFCFFLFAVLILGVLAAPPASEAALTDPNCMTCHDNVVDDPGTSGNETLTFHHGLGITDCAFCHVAPSPTCTTCHGTQFSHANVGTVDGSGNVISDGDGHLVDEVAGCASCHTDLNNMYSGIEATHAPTTGALPCYTCHTSTRADVVGTINDGVLAGPADTGANCASCHDPHNFGLIHDITATDGCASCHDALNNPDPKAGIEAVHDTPRNGDGSCATCHSSSDTTTQDYINNGEADTLECADCHANHVFNDIHSISETLGCAACHPPLDGTSNLTFIETVHDTDTNGEGTCATCHSSPRDDVQDFIDAKDPVVCADCHAAHDFVALHDIVQDTGCVDCHTELGAGKSGIETVHDLPINGPDSCSTCHQSPRPEVQAAIDAGFPPGDPASCGTCHAPPHGTTPGDVAGAHNFFADSTDCNSCHVSGTAEQRINLHTDCSTCHDSSQPDVMDAISDGRGGTTVSCENCHTGPTNGAKDHGTDAASVADAHEDFFKDSDNCTACHETASAVSRLLEHPISASDPASDCLGCHNSTNNAVEQAIDKGKNGEVIATCDSCHFAANTIKYHALDTAGAALFHNNLDEPATSCADCHDTGTFAARIDLHQDCTTCHASPKTTVSTAIDAGKGDTGSLQSCEKCHTGPPAGTDNQGAPDHGIEAGTAAESHDNFIDSDNCTACHMTSSPVIRLSIHLDGCTTCHSSTKPTVEDTIAAGIGGTDQSCDNCHTGDADDVPVHGLDSAGAQDIHENLGGSSGNTCGGCHMIADAKQRIDVHPDCTTCHTDTRSDITGAIANGKGGATQYCETCHTGTNDGAKDHGTDAASVAGAHEDFFKDSDNCTACHETASAVSRLLEHPISASDPASDCLGCHNSTNNAVEQAIDKGKNGEVIATCDSCHFAANTIKYHGLTAATVADDHNNLAEPAPNTCADCHMTADDSAQARIEIHFSNCLTCHTSPKSTVGTIIDAGKGLGGTAQNCQACHNGPPEGGDANAAMLHGVDASGAASSHEHFEDSGVCTVCHDTESPVARLLAHPVSATDPASDCSTCHESTNAFVVTTITNGRNNINVSCENCHREDNTIKYHGLDNAGAAPEHNNFEEATDCGQCHDIDTAEKRLAVHKQGCNTCHADADSIAVIDSARGDSTTKVDCKSCHGEYSHPNATHLNINLNTQPCWNCHGQGTRPAVDIHGDDCLLCHTNTRPNVIAAIAAGQDGTMQDCTACHKPDADPKVWPDDHHIPAHDNTFTPEQICQDCHEENVAIEHHLKRGTLCGACHIPDPQIGPIIASGRSSSPDPQPVYCDTCHVATSMETHRDGHDKTILPVGDPSCVKCHVPNVAVEHVDKRGLACTVCHASTRDDVKTAIEDGSGNDGITINCSDCHTGPLDHKAVHDTETDDVSCQECHSPNVVTEHVDKRGNECAICHEDPLLSAEGGIIDQGIANTITVKCSTCHITIDHSMSHNDTNVPEPVCENCHDPNVFVEHVTVRNRDCNICHNPTYQGVIDDGVANTITVTCTSCHGPTPNHHDNDTARTGMCTTCHGDPRPLDNDPQQLVCRECHIDNNGFVMTSSPSPSHAWNTDPDNNNIKDFGACFACHAPVPYHAKPVPGSFECWDTNPSYPGYIPGLTPGRGTFNLFWSEFHLPDKYYDNTPDEEKGKDYCRRYRNDFDQPNISFYWFPIVYQGTMMDVPAFDMAQPFPPYPHDRINAVGNCGDCHTVGTVIEVTHSNDCIGCHFSQVKAVQNTISWARTGAGNDVDCFDCHGDQGHDAQHDMTVLPQPTCGSCHVANVVTEHLDNPLLSCSTCHDSNDPNVINAIANGKNGFEVSCLDCHMTADHLSLHAATNVDQPGCADCHDPNVVTEHLNNQGLDCINCHESTNQDVLDTIAGLNGDVTCSDCHGLTDHTAAHDNTGPNGGTNCTDCHSANVVTEHITNQNLTCGTCHDEPAYATLIENGKTGQPQYYVSCEPCHGDNASDHRTAHDMASTPSNDCNACHETNVIDEHLDNPALSCSTCHDSNDPQVQQAITDGMNNISVTCYNCHGQNPHHGGNESQAGNCTYCHADPRLNEPQAEVIPSGQLVCRECHGSYQHGNGGPIQDFSACFACHQPVPYHAAPTQNFECWDTNPSSPTYISGLTPGRGSFNLFWSVFHLPDKYYDNTPDEEMGKDYCRRYRNDFDTPAINFNSVSFFDFFNTNQEWTVPTFEAGDGSQLPSSPPGGGGPPGGGDDDVNITYASYSSRRDRLTVYAENTLGDDAQLTVQYDGNSYQMDWDNGDNRWEIRINGIQSCSNSTVEVVSSAGGSDSSNVSNCSSWGW